jgi:hypothetical protein
VDRPGVGGRSRDLRFRQRRDDPRLCITELDRHHGREHRDLIQLIVLDQLDVIRLVGPASPVGDRELVVRLWRRRLGRILEPA